MSATTIRITDAAHAALKEWVPVPGEVIAENHGECVLRIGDDVMKRLEALRAHWNAPDFSRVVLHMIDLRRRELTPRYCHQLGEVDRVIQQRLRELTPCR